MKEGTYFDLEVSRQEIKLIKIGFLKNLFKISTSWPKSSITVSILCGNSLDFITGNKQKGKDPHPQKCVFKIKSKPVYSRRCKNGLT